MAAIAALKNPLTQEREEVTSAKRMSPFVAELTLGPLTDDIHLVMMYIMSHRTDTRALILATLANGPTHGYGIAKAIRSRSQDLLKLGEGQIYPMLHEMEESGWVESDWEMTQGDPPRKVYRLTDEGQRELDRRIAHWSAFVQAVSLVLRPEVAP